MAITRVRIKIDGKWTNLVKNDAGKWQGTVTAPAVTSFNLSGGYYPAVLELTNDAGTVKTVETTDGEWGNILKLVVKEIIKPVITLVSPSNGAYVTNNKQPVTFTVTDEANGSGIKLTDVVLELDGVKYGYNSAGMTNTAVTNGYRFVYTPAAALKDGRHTIKITAKDNDGNAAKEVSAACIVDTVPPALNISSPAAGLITNNPALTVRGTTNDATSSPIKLSIVLNGNGQGSVSVDENGSFSKNVTLTEGKNTLEITATDAAGKSSKVTREVKLDTSIPQVRSLIMAPNPANASDSVSVTVEVV